MVPQSDDQCSIAEPAALLWQVLSRDGITAVLAQLDQEFYQRIYTPLVVVWLWLYQWLAPDHSLDAAVSYAASGALDVLESPLGRRAPLSQRLRSQSNSAYSQARQRLPLAVLSALLAATSQACRQALATPDLWLGHPVVLLDGTTLPLAPAPELVAYYGQATNQHGAGYWVQMRLVSAFCLHSGAVLGLSEGPYQSSEQDLALALFAHTAAGSLIVGDSNFGVFFVVQAAQRAGRPVLFRLSASRAQALRQRQTLSGEDCAFTWQPSAYDRQQHPDLPSTTVPGRLLCLNLPRPGFRPLLLYLFTSLVDRRRYPASLLADLYAQRWQVELNLRHLKTTLGLAQLCSKSLAMVRKDLLAALVAYNLIRFHMLRARQTRQPSTKALSFKRCWRRLRHQLTHQHLPVAELWQLLARCPLTPHCQPRLEPRKVRPKPHHFSHFKNSRAEQRQQILAGLAPPVKS